MNAGKNNWLNCPHLSQSLANKSPQVQQESPQYKVSREGCSIPWEHSCLPCHMNLVFQPLFINCRAFDGYDTPLALSGFKRGGRIWDVLYLAPIGDRENPGCAPTLPHVPQEPESGDLMRLRRDVDIHKEGGKFFSSSAWDRSRNRQWVNATPWLRSGLSFLFSIRAAFPMSEKPRWFISVSFFSL